MQWAIDYERAWDQVVPAEHAAKVQRKDANIRAAKRWLDLTRREDGKTLTEWLRRPEVTVADALAAGTGLRATEAAASESGKLENLFEATGPLVRGTIRRWMSSGINLIYSRRCRRR